MRRALAMLGVALTTTALLLTACGTSGTAVHGQVTGKEYEPAHTTWSTQPKTRQVCTTKTRRTGKKTRTSRSCHTVRTGTRRIAHRTAACWELELDTGDEVCVTAAKWHHTHVGDRI